MPYPFLAHGPLASADDPQILAIVETTEKAMDSSSLLWAGIPAYVRIAFRNRHREGEAFHPHARMTAILENAAMHGRDQMLLSAFDSDRPDRQNWPDREWEWAGLVPGNA